MTLSLFDRKSSWEEAQAHCESLHKTLLQFTMSMYLDIRAFHYSMGEDFRELMFLGLSKNEKVRVNALKLVSAYRAGGGGGTLKPPVS